MATPKLRFKEFDGDWTSKQLGKIIGISSASRVFKEQWQDSGVPFFRTSDVVSIFKNKENEKAYISLELFEELAKKSGKIKQGDLLVTGGGSIGIPYLVPNDQPLYFKDADLLWMKSSGIVEGSFLYNFFISPKFREYLKSISHTGTISHFTIEQAKATPFGFPSKEEQTKIASFFSAVDEKISQLTQKHQLLSQYKQGMMQKLFSHQLRFKADDGSEFGEWENKTLSNFIIKHIGGASLKPSDFVEQSEYEVIPKKAIVPNGYLNLDKDNPTYCSEDFFKANLKNTVDNTYLVTVLRDLVPSGPSIGYIVKYMENTQYILAQGVYGFKLKEELNKDFLIHFSNTKAYRLVMQSIMVGSTQVHIRNQDFFGIEIPVPCLEEQTKIANFLSAIDQKIEVVAQQIEQAKTWKTGLLQQMFV